MANMFGFTPVTDYTRQADLGFKMSQDTATKTKKAMQNISGIVIEKRIAKQYPDAPYGEEALKARVQAYAGIDPERSQQAQKMLQSTYDRSVQQSKISLDKTKFGYNVAKDERDFSYTAQKDTDKLAFDEGKEERLGREFKIKQKLEEEKLFNKGEEIGIKEAEFSASEAEKRRVDAAQKVTADLNQAKFLEAVRAKGVEEGYTEQRLSFEQKKLENDIANGSIVYDPDTGQWFDKRTRKVIDIEGNASTAEPFERLPVVGTNLSFTDALTNANDNLARADQQVLSSTRSGNSNNIAQAEASQEISKRNLATVKESIKEVKASYQPVVTAFQPILDAVKKGNFELKKVRASDNPAALAGNLRKIISRMDSDPKITNFDYQVAFGDADILKKIAQKFATATTGELTEDTLDSIQDLFDFQQQSTIELVREREWSIISRQPNGASIIADYSIAKNTNPLTEAQLKIHKENLEAGIAAYPEHADGLRKEFYITSGRVPSNR